MLEVVWSEETHDECLMSEQLRVPGGELPIPAERKIILSVVCLIFLRRTKHTTKSIRTPNDRTIIIIVPFDSDVSGFWTLKLVVGLTSVSVDSVVLFNEPSILEDSVGMTGWDDVVTLNVSENSEPRGTFMLNTLTLKK